MVFRKVISNFYGNIHFPSKLYFSRYLVYWSIFKSLIEYYMNSLLNHYCNLFQKLKKNTHTKKLYEIFNFKRFLRRYLLDNSGNENPIPLL